MDIDLYTADFKQVLSELCNRLTKPASKYGGQEPDLDRISAFIANKEKCSALAREIAAVNSRFDAEIAKTAKAYAEASERKDKAMKAALDKFAF